LFFLSGWRLFATRELVALGLKVCVGTAVRESLLTAMIASLSRPLAFLPFFAAGLTRWPSRPT